MSQGMTRIALILAAATIASACGAPASASDSDWLKRQIASARSGAVIEIPAGDYDLTDFAITRSVTLEGDAGGGTVFRSAAVTEKGILVPLAGVNLTVRNITFSGAKSWDRNGAGIRHEGRNLTVENCKFIENEEGILSTGDPKGAVAILKSDFVDNGFGDGQSHGVYLSIGARLEVTGSHFIGTRIGHHIKSLADVTIVRGTVMDDGYGRSSYAIDISRGGDVTIENNKFIQAADGENYSIVNYELTRGGAATRLVVSGNEIVNYFDGGVFLRNDTKLAPQLSENRIENKGKKPLLLTSPGSPP